MFRQVLYTQWKWARIELIAYALGAFLVPTIVVKFLFRTGDGFAIQSMLMYVAGAGAFFVVLAFAVAVGLAARPWTIDAGLRHVYALSLPVPWATFVRYRFAAGALLIVVPTIAVWLGGVIATSAVVIPPTLHAYPGGVAIRFGLSALVMYAAVFVLQYLAGRKASRWVLVAFSVLVVGELGGRVFNLGSLIDATWTIVSSWPGPFETLSARWMLIDV